MALTKTMPDPSGGPGETIEGYIWITECMFNFASGFGRVVFQVHRSEAAANARAVPAKILTLEMWPGGKPALKDSEGNVLAAAIPPFNQLMYQERDVIGALAQALYTLGLQVVPELVGATEIPLQPIEPPT